MNNGNNNCDSIARLLAISALEAAQSGGGGKGINNVYILDGHLHMVYTTGEDVDVGQVVGAPGKDGEVYEPSIVKDEDGRVILHWTLVEEPSGEVPEDIVLHMERAEWSDLPPDERADKYSEIDWSGLDVIDDSHPEHGFSGDVPNILQNTSGAEDYMWESI